MGYNQHDETGYEPVPSDDAAWKCGERCIHTVPDLLAAVRLLAAEMVLWGYGRMDVFAMRSALGEALLNAIQHGHQGDPGKTVRLHYVISTDYVLAEVLDEGPGFEPGKVANPFEAAQQGRPACKGLYLMRLLMSWVRFDGRGNRVTLCKLRTPPSEVVQR
jgi:anti-sigma regulatory factor (Ser/Thr protein kinase)